jgi:hypothetical protein
MAASSSRASRTAGPNGRDGCSALGGAAGEGPWLPAALPYAASSRRCSPRIPANLAAAFGDSYNSAMRRSRTVRFEVCPRERPRDLLHVRAPRQHLAVAGA